MRILALAALTMVTAIGTTAAEAQRLGHGGSQPGVSYPPPPMQHPPIATGAPRTYPGQTYPGQRPMQGPMQGQMQRQMQGGGGARWGGQVGGRWSGAMNAPGGWNAYRRPSRGYRLPTYWISPSFFIGDFGGYGLYAPPQGYGWQRYYDDAVLVDPRGRVSDTVSGIDWDRGYGDSGFSQGGYGPADYGDGQYQQPLPPVSQSGGVTTYSTGGYYAGGGAYYPGATTTVVTIQSAPTITTTTTEYIETVRTHYVAPRRVYRAKKRVYRPARCSCRRAAPVEKPVMGS